MKLITVALTLMFLSQASHADLIEKRFKPTKGGVVSYRLLPWGNDGRKADALKEAEAFCDTEIEVLGESSSSEIGGMIHMGYGMSAPVNRKYEQISFDCAPAKPLAKD